MPRRSQRRWSYLLPATLAIAWAAAAQADEAATPAAAGSQATDSPANLEFFEKKVRPLLATRCQSCHGEQKQKGGLRLDSRTAAIAGGDTGVAIVPGKPDESLLVDAIRYGDSYQMPPKSQMPAEEIAVLVEWVRLGAPWPKEAAVASAPAKPADFNLRERAKHWSFQALTQPVVPKVNNIAWPAGDIDRFLLAKLEAAGLQPAPPADKRALLRRVTFDLTGLPPTPAEIDAFLADGSAKAYETVVERLLASPRYGERWGRHWLDLARFAETMGHEFDFEMPNAFRYRDYVIRALNDDVPYDQFVIEHVAGDLLAPPRLNREERWNESILATGFWHFGEAKHSPVDVRQDEADRIDNQVDVLAKTFLGLTVSCARCHDHKFDAISTKDYYAFCGYLQSSRYQQAFIDEPALFAPIVEQLREIRRQEVQLLWQNAPSELRRRGAALREMLVAANETEPEAKAAAAESAADKTPTTAARLKKYLQETARRDPTDVFYPWTQLVGPKPISADLFSKKRAELAARLKDHLKEAQSSVPPNATVFGPADFAKWDKTGLAFDVSIAGDEPGAAREAHSGQLSHRLQGALRSPTFTLSANKIFYQIRGTGGEARLIVDGLQVIRSPIYGGLSFKPKSEQAAWHAQDVGKWVGHNAYIEVLDDNESYVAIQQIVMADATPVESPSRLLVAMLEDESITTPALLADRYAALFGAVADSFANRAGLSAEQLADASAVASAAMSLGFLDRSESPLAELKKRRAEIEAKLPPQRRALAMLDGTAENERVFVRGSHKTLGDEVPRRFLEALGGTEQAPPEQGSGRLELARQIVGPGNPLASRVMVNRLWHHHFGAGLVRTPDDFGVMGQPPTHPELLDFLAGQFIREGWSLKKMHRLMLLSSAYRMSSSPEPVADLADPQNKLWHRRNVQRLEAECIRDAVLAVSGRLNPKMYGPAVSPYLTAFMNGRGRPGKSGPLDGDGRRSIYLNVRRNFLSPFFLAFDYPQPFTTIGRRSASNVPAQALAMMNNPFVIEQAGLWAKRVLAQPGADAEKRVGQMYVTAFGRPARDDESAAALEFLTSRTLEAGDADNAQAWSDLAHVLLNVKEFIFIP